ncbi:hypothetical protein IV203_028064 [Nitzschia inconspicua]|uniref:Uncharacterized protein n=1 Tax=Nitzschia inconspicua TaxID=303405 RepID=A0A9K3Q3Z8_9STRA|nr:hypothetical protein IV203_028064 [Nitzschia inconspicua]
MRSFTVRELVIQDSASCYSDVSSDSLEDGICIQKLESCIRDEQPLITSKLRWDASNHSKTSLDSPPTCYRHTQVREQQEQTHNSKDLPFRRPVRSSEEKLDVEVDSTTLSPPLSWLSQQEQPMFHDYLLFQDSASCYSDVSSDSLEDGICIQKLESCIRDEQPLITSKLRWDASNHSKTSLDSPPTCYRHTQVREQQEQTHNSKDLPFRRPVRSYEEKLDVEVDSTTLSPPLSWLSQQEQPMFHDYLLFQDSASCNSDVSSDSLEDDICIQKLESRVAKEQPPTISNLRWDASNHSKTSLDSSPTYYRQKQAREEEQSHNS